MLSDSIGSYSIFYVPKHLHIASFDILGQCAHILHIFMNFFIYSFTTSSLLFLWSPSMKSYYHYPDQM